MKTIKIGKYDVDKEIALLYVHHFGKDKNDLFSWEKQRKSIHNLIFESLGLNRTTSEGLKFSEEFDKWAEPLILKFDPLTSKLKKLSRSKDEKELEQNDIQIKMELVRQEFMRKNGIRNVKVDDSNCCRICKKNLGDGTPRINDHLAQVAGFDEVNSPICIKCSDNNPDEYNIAFKKQYWNK